MDSRPNVERALLGAVLADPGGRQQVLNFGQGRRSAAGSSGRCAGTAIRRAAVGGSGPGAHLVYSRRRARQIAYGRWEPWADAAPVRDHVRVLREGGASYRAIAGAAGVSTMMVHRLMNGCPAQRQPLPRRIGSAHARRLLAVAPGSAGLGRREACGSRRRLRALIAIGHSPAHLARQADITPARTRRLLTGQTRSVSPELHATVSALYERMWNQLPAEHSSRGAALAKAARRRAETAGWLPPMALDDDRIDDPAYRPRTAWRKAVGLPSRTRWTPADGAVDVPAEPSEGRLRGADLDARPRSGLSPHGPVTPGQGAALASSEMRR